MYGAPRKRLFSTAWLLIFAWLAAGCQPAVVTRAPELTLQVLRVSVDPALDWLTPGLAACTAQVPGVGIIRQDSPAADTALTLRYGAPETYPGAAVQLGEDELVVAVNAKNELASLTLEDLQSIFAGKALAWSEFDFANCAECSNEDNQITVWTYASDSPLQRQAKSAFNLSTFSPDTQVAAGPADMIQAISTDPFAIGIVPRRWLNDSVRALPISAAGLQDKVILPILALSEQPVEGMARDWLLCLQDLFAPGQ